MRSSFRFVLHRISSLRKNMAWETRQRQHVLKNSESGMYYAWIKQGGKRVWLSLKTDTALSFPKSSRPFELKARGVQSSAAIFWNSLAFHHDLQHLFATKCIESRVDIPPVARWLEHKDGGVLALKTSGVCGASTHRRWREGHVQSMPRYTPTFSLSGCTKGAADSSV